MEYKELLDQLPSEAKSPCKDCGNYEWRRCNPHPDGGFFQCDKCHVYDKEADKLVRIL